jgi:hypothetical protein
LPLNTGKNLSRRPPPCQPTRATTLTAPPPTPSRDHLARGAHAIQITHVRRLCADSCRRRHIVELDLDELAAIVPPLGYGRD